MWQLHALPQCNLSLLQDCLSVRRKIVARIGTGFRQVRVMALDIASLRRGGIIKFVPSAITTKAVVFVSVMATGGKGVDQLTGGLGMNLRSQKVASHLRGQMVAIFG